MELNYSDIVAGLIITAITILSSSFFKVFWNRQLYLVIDRPMNFPNPLRTGYQVSVSIINRGKDKEENIEVLFHNTRSLKLIATNYSAVSVNGHRITIDRLLAGTEITFSLNVISDYEYNILPLPTIKSNDANGKSFKSFSDVPQSKKTYISLGMSIVFLLTFMVFFPRIFNGAKEAYDWYIYSDYNDMGFSVDEYSINKTIDGFTFKNGDFPIYLNSFIYENNTATYKFTIKNNKLDPVSGRVSFVPRDRAAYFNEYEAIEEKYQSLNPQKYLELVNGLDEKYFLNGLKTQYFTIPPMQSIKLEIKRPLPKGIGYNDMRLLFNLKQEGLGKYEDASITFDSQKNKDVSKILNQYIK